MNKTCPRVLTRNCLSVARHFRRGDKLIDLALRARLGFMKGRFDRSADEDLFSTVYFTNSVVACLLVTTGN